MEEASKFHTVRGYQLMERGQNIMTSAMEDYLEMIYRNSISQGYMRINTLSHLLSVSAPSATRMVQKLSRLGYLDYKKYGILVLTEDGSKVGAFLLKRHETIENFLLHLGVKENMLLETELIEHNISTITLKKLEQLNSFLEHNPDVIERYKQFTATLSTVSFQ